jgi:hypothetical protein
MDRNHRMPSGIADSRVRAVYVGDMYCWCRVDHRAGQAGGGITPLLYQGFLLKLYVEHGPDLLDCSTIFPCEIETNDDWRDRSVGI